MKTIIILINIIILIISTNYTFSQKYTISGKITDKYSGESIIDAVIFEKNSGNYVSSNNYGFYSLSFSKQDSIILQISYIGYTSVFYKIELKANITLNFELTENTHIEEVVISAEDINHKKNIPGVINIPVKQINTLPIIGAESDLIKAFQLMPGIQSGNEGSSDLYVRGGSPDQNLILLDDVPLYYVNHLGGFISIFNTDAINNVKLIKGSFPAQYGGRLSSVLDVKMKDGNMKKKSCNYSIGTVTSKIFFETPLKKDTSSFLFSARGLLWGFIYQPISRLLLENVSVGYNFYDINSKYNYKINNTNRLFISFYAGNDKLKFKAKEKLTGNTEIGNYSLKWGNLLSSLRWNKVFSKKLFSNMTLAYTRYKYRSDMSYTNKISNENMNISYLSGINDLILKYDFNLFLSENYLINTGMQVIHHTFNPGINKEYFSKNDSVIKNEVFGNNPLNSTEGSLYIENSLKLGSFSDINIGLRAVDYLIQNTHFISIEPRILINFYISESSAVKASYTVTQQNVHLLTSSSVGLPADIWVPATLYAVPENASQYSFGFYKIFHQNNIKFTIESYFKKMENLIAYKEGINYQAAGSSWEDKIEINGKGSSYGIEILFQKNIGKTTGWLGYTFSKTNRLFQEINNGKTYPFKYDRRHDLSLVFNRKIFKNITFSASWVFGSGYPYTLPLNKYISADDNYNDQLFYDEVFNWSDRNSYRMRCFHHLDISLFFKKNKKRGTGKWSVNIYNVYNRQNPYYYYLTNETGQWKLYQKSLFPIIPSINYSFVFK